VRREVAEALNAIQAELEAQGLGLKIFDGYRPLSVQQLMWDLIQDERYVSNPAKNKGRHTRGTAVETTLVNTAGEELAMPTPFDDFTERAHSDYMDLPADVIANRALLRSVMEAHGFSALDTEWWHFDYIGWENDEKFPPLSLSFEEIEEWQNGSSSNK
jgi:D-alanyl-D-alanine dipeptidase